MVIGDLASESSADLSILVKAVEKRARTKKREKMKDKKKKKKKKKV